MSHCKLSKADYKALNRSTPVRVRYPLGGRAELHVATTKRGLRRRKSDNEGGT